MGDRKRQPRSPMIKSFDHDDLTIQYCYFGYSRPPDGDGIKLFHKND